MSDNPLTPTDLQAINAGLAAISEARRLIDKACPAGVDCTAYAQAADVIEQRLLALRQQFFGVDP